MPQLIVRRKQVDDASLTKIVSVLSSRFSLGAYSTKQALRGFGLALLMKGSRSKLEAVADACRDYGFDTWLIEPLAAPSRPNLVRGISRRKDAMVCHGNSSEIVIHRGDYLLAVLGDISGSMTDKFLRRHALGGGTGGFSKGQQYETIMRGKPILDVFVIRPPGQDGKPKLAGILRFAPGKFNPAGLGDLAVATTVGNLDALVRLLRNLAGAFLLDLDFGLSQLPRCRPESSASKTPANVDKNTRIFQRYAWVLLQVFLVGKKRTGCKEGGGLPLPKVEEMGVAAMAVAGSGKTPSKNQNDSSSAAVGTAVAAGIASTIQALDDQEQKPGDEDQNTQPKQPLPPPPYIRPPSRFFGLMVSFRGIGLAGFPVAAFLLFLALTAMNKNVADTAVVWGLQKGILFFLGAALCLGMCFKMIWLKRFLENTPTSKVRSAAMGFVEICGTARRAYNVISPVGQWPCVYYRTRRYRRRTDAQGHQTWHLVDDMRSGPIPFYVQDETGKILVDPDGAQIRVRHKHESFGGAGLVRLLGAPTEMDLDEKYIEETIPEMATVYVLGTAKPQRRERPTLRQRVALKLRDLKRDSVRMMKYDLDMDGKIDDREWEMARRDMEESALVEALQEQKDEGPQVVVGRARHAQLPFVVAEDQEPQLTQSYVWKTRLWLAACVVLMIVGVLSLLVDYT